MLTPDLVRARVKNEELVLQPLQGATVERALEIAEGALGVAREHVGRTRSELHRAFGDLPPGARDRKLPQAIAKLVEDRSEFQAGDAEGAQTLREDVFLRASAARKLGGFSRDRVLAQTAAERGATPDAIDAGLFADLRGANVLLRAPSTTAAHLVEDLRLSEVQAVLLRAVRIEAKVRCATPAAYRKLFRTLKFRRLLFRIDPLEDSGYRITIDGPFSLFESVGKYGLALALTLPSLLETDEIDLDAKVRWGPARTPAVFRIRHRGPGLAAGVVALPDEVEALLEGFRRLDSAWSVEPATKLLNLPGLGIAVPDLTFSHRDSGAVVHLEVLGFWSRDAVWKRIEWVERGLPEPVLFAASSRLRVSEEALDQAESGALYVYKGTMSPRAVARKLDAFLKSPESAR